MLTQNVWNLMWVFMLYRISFCSLLCFQTLITSGENYPYLVFFKNEYDNSHDWNYFLLKDFCKKLFFVLQLLAQFTQAEYTLFYGFAQNSRLHAFLLTKTSLLIYDVNYLLEIRFIFLICSTFQQDNCFVYICHFLQQFCYISIITTISCNFIWFLGALFILWLLMSIFCQIFPSQISSVSHKLLRK